MRQQLYEAMKQLEASGGRMEGKRVVELALAFSEAETKNEIFWQLHRYWFLNQNKELIGAQNVLYDAICSQYIGEFGVGDFSARLTEQRRKKDGRKKRVLLSGNAIKNTKHAPTRFLVEMGNMFRRNGHEVFVLYTGMMCRSLSLTYPKPFKFQFPPVIGTGLASIYNYHDETFNIVQGVREQFRFEDGLALLRLVNNPFNRDDVRMLDEEIAEFAPDFIMSIGGHDPLAERYASVIGGVWLPQLSATFYSPHLRPAVTQSMWNTALSTEDRKPIKPMAPLIARLPYPVPFYIANPKLNEALKRVAEQKPYVAIVGNRLHQEVTPELKERMVAFHKKTGARFVLAGDRANQLMDANVGIFGLDTIRDLGALYHFSALNLNPPRGGGGTAAAEATRAGKPTFTLKFGDVYDALGDAFAFDDLDAMFAGIERYYEEEAYRQSFAGPIAEKARELYDSDLFYKAIMAGLEEQVLSSAS
ncbi:hypothetical protein HDIA_2612 [Hartmannibacter diazotrophicus]|uniref:Glycosyl transferases group 1 n=1 Tax=Hartmannibacter diazotrophicus TaxID=1482074 RepID=A0A2C9D7E1_9HYPH|nr:hypothetical protein [Hartmannibacter diazotrophicus]SON56153.1 hypothetical protein HDIA_2612 [Hartmannibacter diazotrophicus]